MIFYLRGGFIIIIVTCIKVINSLKNLHLNVISNQAYHNLKLTRLFCALFCGSHVFLEYV